MLEVRDITKVYNPGTVTEQRLFDHFSLTVEEGQFVSIVGSNGSGKTSLLNIICGSIPIEGGDVLVGGKSIAKRRDYQRYATMGRVYQDPALGTCPSLTVLENLSLADNKGKSFGLGRAVDKRRTDFYRQQLKTLGLGLEDTLDSKFAGRKLVMLVAAMENKDVSALGEIAKKRGADVVATQVQDGRARSAQSLAQLFPACEVQPNLGAAWETARNKARHQGALLVVAGSFYLAGDVLHLIWEEQGAFAQ